MSTASDRLRATCAATWRTWRLAHVDIDAPLGQPGSMTFYQAQPQEHLALAKHLTAETKREEFIAGNGVVTRWERVRRQNLVQHALRGWNWSDSVRSTRVRLLEFFSVARFRDPEVKVG